MFTKGLVIIRSGASPRKLVEFAQPPKCFERVLLWCGRLLQRDIALSWKLPV